MVMLRRSKPILFLFLALWALGKANSASAFLGRYPTANGTATNAAARVVPPSPPVEKANQSSRIVADLSSPVSSWPFVRGKPRAVAPVPLVLNRTVQQYVDAFLDQPLALKLGLQRSKPYLTEMVAQLERAGLPRDLIFLAFAESKFSQHGAGPWQLIRATARRFGLRVDEWVDERLDPVLSTKAAAEYLTKLHDDADDWRVVLAEWNRGENSLLAGDLWNLRGAGYERLLARLPRRTRQLINRFMAVALIARDARAYGFEPVEFYAPPAYYHVKVKGGIPLRMVAAQEGTTVDAIKTLNPAFLADRVPPYVPTYDVRVAIGAPEQASDF